MTMSLSIRSRLVGERGSTVTMVISSVSSWYSKARTLQEIRSEETRALSWSTGFGAPMT